MNNQQKIEIIDRVIAGFTAQGKFSTRDMDQTVCLYRGPNGCKCAIGMLIPDELYDKNMEGRSLYAFWHRDNEFIGFASVFQKAGLPAEPENCWFYTHLQQIHDLQARQDNPVFKDMMAELSSYRKVFE